MRSSVIGLTLLLAPLSAAAAVTTSASETLSASEVRALAKADGKWVHLAVFKDGEQALHLLCRKTKKQATAACISATAKGEVVRSRLRVGLYAGGDALGFEVAPGTTKAWLRLPLAQPTQSESPDYPIATKMEDAFGPDFSNVRVHTDAKTGQASPQLGAAGFTDGKGLSFSRTSETAPPKSLLAHELTHTVQQGSSGAGG